MRGSLVAGTTDSQVVALNPANLALNWSVKVDAPVLDAPAAKGDTLFVATRRGTLYRIAPGGASPRRAGGASWTGRSPRRSPSWTGRSSSAAPMASFAPSRPKGTELWRVQLWRPVELGPVALDDGIIAIGGAGDLHRYRP